MPTLLIVGGVSRKCDATPDDDSRSVSKGGLALRSINYVLDLATLLI